MQTKFCEVNHQLPSLAEANKSISGIDDSPQKILPGCCSAGQELANSPYWAQIEDLIIEYMQSYNDYYRGGYIYGRLAEGSIQEAAEKSKLLLAQGEHLRKVR